jgi:hypothetical protein
VRSRLVRAGDERVADNLAQEDGSPAGKTVGASDRQHEVLVE